MQGFRAIFADIPDPRDFNAQHDLTEILFIALAASLCGADSCVGFAEFGRAKEPLLRAFLTLAHGIPSHDTFTRVLRHLDPQPLEAALIRFVAVLGQALGQPPAGRVVAVDGKRLRGATMPIIAGFPFPLAVEILPMHLPLPAKIRTELLEPIHLDADPDKADDKAYVDSIYREVEGAIQAGMDRLAKRRSFPVFG